MTTSTRRRKLRALAEAHDAWVQRHLTDVAAEFTPREDGSDYNIHNVDVDADGAAEDELAAVAAEIFNAGEPLVADADFERRHPRDGEGQFTEKVNVVGDVDNITAYAKSQRSGDTVAETVDAGAKSRITKVSDGDKYQIQIRFSPESDWVNVSRLNSDEQLSSYLRGQKQKEKLWSTPGGVRSRALESETSPPLSYLSDADAVKMHSEMQASDPWTLDQEEALRDYAGSAYGVINDFLRGVGDELPGPARKKIQSQVDDIRAALRPTTRDLRVARGVAGLAAFGLHPTGEFDQLSELEKLKGRKLREPGFLSTSTRDSWLDAQHELAAELMDESTDAADVITAVEIDVPRGTPAAYLAAPGGPGIKSEGELLLIDGLNYEVVDVFRRPGEAVTVRLRVVS